MKGNVLLMTWGAKSVVIMQFSQLQSIKRLKSLNLMKTFGDLMNDACMSRDC